jgi:capsular polysaccharide biosynthesis protein
MFLKSLKCEREKTTTFPTELPSKEHEFFRFDFVMPEAHNYNRFLGVLNARVVGPFLSEKWLRSRPASGTAVLFARNIRVVGESFMFYRDDLFLPDEEIVHHMETIASRPEQMSRLDRLKCTHPDMFIDRAFVISHFSSKVYGHFLTEIMPKLAIIKDYYDNGIRIPIVLSASEPRFVRNFVRFAIPDAEICTPPSDAGCLVNICLIPSHCSMYLLNSHHLAFIDSLVCKSQILQNKEGVKTPERVIISRQKLGTTYRILENWDQIIRIAEHYGYQVIAPETMPLEQQIVLFAQASHVLGEYGSALHNCLFAQRKQSVLSLNWINLIQQAIGLARGQPNMFIFPESGVPILPGGPIEARYSISGDLLSEALDFLHGGSV